MFQLKVSYIYVFFSLRVREPYRNGLVTQNGTTFQAIDLPDINFFFFVRVESTWGTIDVILCATRRRLYTRRRPTAWWKSFVCKCGTRIQRQQQVVVVVVWPDRQQLPHIATTPSSFEKKGAPSPFYHIFFSLFSFAFAGLLPLLR